MKIYLASIYERRDEMKKYMREIEELGHTVTSRWLKEDFDDTDWQLQTLVDLDDIFNSEVVLVFTEEKGYRGRGGKDFEAGYAMGRGTYVDVIGPMQHQFYSIQARYVDFADWAKENLYK